MLKQRIAAIFITLTSIGILLETRFEAQHGGRYFLKAAAFTPLGIVGGIFLIFFPQFFGKPETTREKLVALAIFVVGLAFGLVNWYSIDPQVFEF